jgi:TolB-like protein/DNA-binding winged helix-turn-helix (wHTH) protein/tetratricopeptide (TPR) repeat protein
MPVSVPSPPPIRFHDFLLDLTARELHKDGQRVALPPKAFEILRALVERPGQVVTREELRTRLWAADTFVEFDDSLNHAVRKLRQALGDSSDAPQFIETLPRHGYRLIVPVDTGRTPELEPTPRRRTAAGPAILGAALLTVVAALLLAFNVREWRSRWFGVASELPIRSLAVLPLSNLSGDPQQDYFAVGMTDALITDLGKVSALRVISRQSVMQYKGTNKPVPQIARELHVDAVVEGSALRVGDKVRITTQLVQADPERHLWSASYERDLSDVITLQREMAQAIVREIRVALTPQEKQSLADARPVLPEAHEAYLKGRYHFDRFSVEDIKKAREWFQRAIEKDPYYAPAYADLARTYTLSPAWDRSVQESYETARGLTGSAIAIDGTLAAAHVVLAEIKREYDWDWAGAEEESKRAISMNPSDADAHAQYAALLSYMARHDEALREAKFALQLNPVALYTNGQLGYTFYWARRYDEAIDQFRKTLDLDRTYHRAHVGLGRAYLEKGMLREGIETLKEGEGLLSLHQRGSNGFLGYAYGVLGEKSEALKIANQVRILRDRGDPDATWGLARMYAGLGDKDRAVEFVRKAYEEHYPSMEVIKVDPQFDRLRSDPRFQDVLRRMNFPP